MELAIKRDVFNGKPLITRDIKSRRSSRKTRVHSFERSVYFSACTDANTHTHSAHSRRRNPDVTGKSSILYTRRQYFHFLIISLPLFPVVKPDAARLSLLRALGESERMLERRVALKAHYRPTNREGRSKSDITSDLSASDRVVPRYLGAVTVHVIAQEGLLYVRLDHLHRYRADRRDIPSHTKCIVGAYRAFVRLQSTKRVPKHPIVRADRPMAAKSARRGLSGNFPTALCVIRARTNTHTYIYMRAGIRAFSRPDKIAAANRRRDCRVKFHARRGSARFARNRGMLHPSALIPY